MRDVGKYDSKEDTTSSIFSVIDTMKLEKSMAQSRLIYYYDWIYRRKLQLVVGLLVRQLKKE